MQNKNHLGYEIHILDKMIGRTFHALFEKEDITKMQNWIIHYLYDHKEESIYQKDIESQFHIARSTATGILKGMEKRGFIIRESIDSDARLKRLLLTDKAVHLQQQLISNIQQMENALRTNISEEEITIFLKVMHQMCSNIDPDYTERSFPCLDDYSQK